MDWGTVSNAELLSALREVDWKQRPRSAAEFFTRFTPPKSSSRLASRVKCNVYYYRTNYVRISVVAQRDTDRSAVCVWREREREREG